jgi:glycosyltransferase involved in cell wall biosynthesis
LALARREVSDLVLLLVGQGELEERLQERARAAGLADAVRFVGAVADVAPCYRIADLFVFPSRYEAFGLALLEAMAAGLPIVAARTGGIPELATEEAALLIPGGDVSELAKGLVSLASSPERRRYLGSAARNRARAFDVRHHLPRLEELYASL